MSRLPQVFGRVTTLRFHLTFLFCLVPVAAEAVWLKGAGVAVLVALSLAAAWLGDEVLRLINRTDDKRDASAPVWGLLLGLLMPVQAPLYLPVVGAAAVIAVKGLMGSGVPWVNPVLAAWAFLQAGWPSAFAGWTAQVGADRTPFDQQGTDWLNASVFSWLGVQLPGGYLDLAAGLGHGPASLIVESGTLWLLAGTVLLLAKGYIPWEVPTFFFLGFCVPLELTGGNALLQVFSGAFLLCLFFLAPAPSTRPLGRSALIVFAAGSGVAAFAVRTWGLAPDGVCYAVLAMNLLVPWLDRRLGRKSPSDFRAAR